MGDSVRRTKKKRWGEKGEAFAADGKEVDMIAIV